MQRGRAASPLAKMVLYYKTHLAVSPFGGLRALYYKGLLRRTKTRKVHTTARSTVILLVFTFSVHHAHYYIFEVRKSITVLIG